VLGEAASPPDAPTPEATFHDLGADHYDRHVDTGAKKPSHIRQLEALGCRVCLEPAA